MPEKLPRQGARNDEGRRKRVLSEESRALVDEVSSEVHEMRSSLENRIDATDDALAAVKETLANGEVQAGLDKIIALEETLAKLPTDGDESIQNRLGNAEVALQRLGKPGREEEIPGVKSVRAQAREVLADECSRNPVYAAMIKHDPSLSSEYQEAFAIALSRGTAMIMSNPKRLEVAAAANTYLNRVWRDPAAVRAAGGKVDQVMNSLTTDFDPGYGMRVPIPLATRIVRRASELSPLLADSGQATTAANVYVYLADTGWDPAVRVRGERQDVIEDDDNDELYVQRQIDIHEESITTRLTLVQIEDGLDPVFEYEFRTGRAMGKLSSRKVYYGSGTKQPLGLTKDPNVVRVKTGTATTLPFKSLLNASLDLDPEYENGARYYLSKGATKAAVFATDAVGQFLWQPSQIDGTPSLIHGYTWKRDAYLSNEDEVTDTSVTFPTGAFPVVFGNPGIGCLNVSRLGLQVQIDDLTKKGWRKYWTRRRWGWGVVDPAALRLVEVGV